MCSPSSCGVREIVLWELRYGADRMRQLRPTRRSCRIRSAPYLNSHNTISLTPQLEGEHMKRLKFLFLALAVALPLYAGDNKNNTPDLNGLPDLIVSSD